MAVERWHLLDIWQALGGEPEEFERWMDEPRRSVADAWAQLMAAIRGDIDTLEADTNPPAGYVLYLAFPRRPSLSDLGFTHVARCIECEGQIFKHPTWDHFGGQSSGPDHKAEPALGSIEDWPEPTPYKDREARS